ncbi:MAG: ribonuclease Z [archaeon]
MDITFLGTTAGKPTKDRAHSAIALKHKGEVLLFDCGENTQRQLMFAGISPMKINKVFINHWHADHFAGLIGFLQTMSLQERTAELHIYGPKGTKKFVGMIEKLGYSRVNYPIRVKDISGAEIVAVEPGYTVYSCPTVHSVPTIAYKFEENETAGHLNVEKAKALGVNELQFRELKKGKAVKTQSGKVKPDQVLGPEQTGKSIVYSGDTAPCDGLIEFSKNADLLIHEATYTDELKDKAENREHSTARQAAEIAKKANVKRLILTHISGRYKETTQLLKEARGVFENTEVAEDLMKIELK